MELSFLLFNLDFNSLYSVVFLFLYAWNTPLFCAHE
jgi:hypothetical protein